MRLSKILVNYKFAYIYYIYIYNNSARHFFKTVIFRILQILNGLLQRKSVKRCRQTE